MESSMPTWARAVLILLTVMIVVVSLGLALLWRESEQQNRELTRTVEQTLLRFDTLEANVGRRFAGLEQSGLTLADDLYNTQKLMSELTDIVDDFGGDVRKLSGSVTTLEKLTTTDPELLQKYSKVYFLNEHYTPADLVIIDEKYDLPNGKEVSIHGEVWPFLKELLERADRDGLDLQVLSGYRSFDEQSTLKQNYLTRYGTGANTFSADQGYSEHQLGTSVDFTNTTIGENIDSFGETDEYAWLLENAYKYGFVLSYPENNAYYQYEPWHWRFVGKALARDLERQEKYFYDLEQREIDSYIPELFED